MKQFSKWTASIDFFSIKMNDRKKEPVGALKGQKAWERVTCVVQNIYIKLKEK